MEGIISAIISRLAQTFSSSDLGGLIGAFDSASGGSTDKFLGGLFENALKRSNGLLSSSSSQQNDEETSKRFDLLNNTLRGL